MGIHFKLINLGIVKRRNMYALGIDATGSLHFTYYLYIEQLSVIPRYRIV